MQGIEQVTSVLRKYNYSDIQLKVLDHTTPKGNRAAAKASAAKVDAAL